MPKNEGSISVIVLTKNAASTLKRTLDSVGFGTEILVLDDQSSDGTVDMAAEYGCRVISTSGETFAQRRTLGMEKALHPWVLYIDADEVVSDDLRDELMKIVTENTSGVYRLQRRNYFLGTEMYPDAVERLFHKESLQGWEGAVHETPIYSGEVVTLASMLDHYTHRDIQSMLEKTNAWSEVEAKLRLDAKHPPVYWWRLIRIGLTVFWEQFVDKRVWRYGRNGVFEGYFQMVDKLIVYTKLYEMQLRQTD